VHGEEAVGRSANVELDPRGTEPARASKGFDGILGEGNGGSPMGDDFRLQESPFGQRNILLPLCATEVTIPLLPAPPDQISSRGSM